MNETTTGKLFDVERLQQLSYERSTKWANFLDSIAESENHKEIHIDDLEKLYENDADDLDDLASMEDEDYDDKSLDSEVLRDITNSTRLALMLNGHSMTSKLCESNVQDENLELVDLFNQTMPVINEHNRQLRESGFERILNTFDVKKIEEKVGGWLNRHNSLYGGDYKAHEHTHAAAHSCRLEAKVAHQSETYRDVALKPYHNEETDSDGSFHSGETARYIRSSRAGALKNSSSSTTMMIKTYRMVKSTRQALKEKYACAQDDDAETHLSKLRHRRRIANDYELLHHNAKHSARSHKNKCEYMTPSCAASHQLKRKVLRKRSINNSCSAMETSSESDTGGYGQSTDKYYRRGHSKHCGQCHCSMKHRYGTTPLTTVAASARRLHRSAARKTPCVRRDRLYYYDESHSLSASFSSSSSCSNTYERRTLKRGDKRKCSDSRPYKLESECRCCNEKRLCREYKHLAQTSTEEWLVENSYCHKKLHNMPTSEPVRYNPIEQEIFPISNIQNNMDDKPTTSRADRKLASSSVPETNGPKKKGSKKIAAKVNKKKEEINETTDDANFKLELEIALKASKELYEKEQREKLKKKMEKEDGHNNALSETEGKKTVNVQDTKSVKKQQLKRKLLNNVSDVNEEVQFKSPDNQNIPAKPPSNKSLLTNKKNLTIAGTEETFFAATARVCNSTAVPSDEQAYQREIGEDNNTIKTMNVKKHISRKDKVIRKTPKIAEEQVIEDDKNKPLKKLSKYVDYYTPVKSRPLRKTATALQSAEEFVNAKPSTFNDTPRPKANRGSSSTLNNDVAPNSESSVNQGHVFVKPQGRAKVNASAKNDATTEVTFISGCQAVCNSTAQPNDKSSLGRQIKERSFDEADFEQEETNKSRKRKQQNETLSAKTNKLLDLKNLKTVEDLENNKFPMPNIESKSITKEKRSNLSLTTKLKKPRTEDLRSKNKHTKDTEQCMNIETVDNKSVDSNSISQTSSDQNSIQYLNAKSASNKDLLEQITDSACKDNQTKVMSSEEIRNTNATYKGNESVNQTQSRYQKNNNSNVTSTTIHSPDISQNLKKTKKSRTLVIDSSSDCDDNDCTVVSSTTNVEPPQSTKDTPTLTKKSSHIEQNTTATTTLSSHSAIESVPFSKPLVQQETNSSMMFKLPQHHSRHHHHHHPKKGILIYSPRDLLAVPAHSFSKDGSFFHVTKEHLSSIIGEKPAEKFLKYYIGRRRFNRSSTIYFRPPTAQVLDTNDVSSSDSDTDDLESIGQYGDLYESLGGDTAGGGEG